MKEEASGQKPFTKTGPIHPATKPTQSPTEA